MKKWVIWTPVVLVTILLLIIFLYPKDNNPSLSFALITLVIPLVILSIILYISSRPFKELNEFNKNPSKNINKKSPFYNRSPLGSYYLEYFRYLKKFWWLQIILLMAVIFLINTESVFYTGIFLIIGGIFLLIGIYKRFPYVTELPHYKINGGLNKENFIRIFFYITSFLSIIAGIFAIIYS